MPEDPKGFITQNICEPFQVGAGEYWGARHHFWDANTALSRNTLLQHNMKENESMLHFPWGYSKSLSLSCKKSPLTSILWAGKHSKERWGALDTVYWWGNRQGEWCYQLEGTWSSRRLPFHVSGAEVVCFAFRNEATWSHLIAYDHFVLFHEFKRNRK